MPPKKKSSVMKTAMKSPMKSVMKAAVEKKSSMKTTPMATAAAATPITFPYYLIKSEPLTRLENGVDVKFSIDDLITHKMEVPGPNLNKIGIAEWDGVRNYQARNNMRAMKIGTKCLFYHSNAKPSGIVGICEIVRTAYPDPHQFDPKDAHYDPKWKDNQEKGKEPTWDCVDVKYVRKLERMISLEEINSDKILGDMFKSGRLSVCGVSEVQWKRVMELEKEKEKGKR